MRPDWIIFSLLAVALSAATSSAIPAAAQEGGETKPTVSPQSKPFIPDPPPSAAADPAAAAPAAPNNAAPNAAADPAAPNAAAADPAAADPNNPAPAAPNAAAQAAPPAPAKNQDQDDFGGFDLTTDSESQKLLDEIGDIQEKKMLIREQIALERLRQEYEQLQRLSQPPSKPEAAALPVAAPAPAAPITPPPPNPATEKDGGKNESKEEVAEEKPEEYPAHSIWTISGKGKRLRAELIAPHGGIVSVRKGDPLIHPSYTQKYAIYQITPRSVIVVNQETEQLYALPMAEARPDGADAITSLASPLAAEEQDQ